MNHPINIIFDATVLTNGFHKNDSRSGIFFVATNILKQFKNRADVNLALYVSPEKYAEEYRLKKESFPDDVFLHDFSNPCFIYLTKILTKLWSIYENQSNWILLKKIAAAGIIILQAFFRRFIKISSTQKKLQKTDLFFSPAYKIPDFIRKSPNIRCYIIFYDAIPFVQLKCYSSTDWANYLKEIIQSTKPTDNIFYISKQTKKDLESIFPFLSKSSSYISYLAANENFRVIKDPVRLQHLKKKYRIPSKKKYIFSLCTIEPRKNLVRAVQCFLHFVKKHNINDLIWVMGGGQWESFIKELTKKNIKWDPKYIIRAGYIDDEDLPVLYSNAEWFVYTSQYEGFGLPPLEAMQCGCPVITSNNSSLPEVVGDAGIMIDWDSDEQHIDAYEKYYFNEELRNENSRKGIEQAKLFSWNKTVDKMINVMMNKPAI